MMASLPPLQCSTVARVALFSLALASCAPMHSQQQSEAGIRHAMVISGPKTLAFNESDEIVWQYDDHSRDISKLENGHYLITYRDRVVEVTPAKEIVWSYTRDKNDELMSAQRLANGQTLVTELGAEPRLVEVDSKGQISKVIPLQPETTNVHMQTRMARKLADDRYLVPHRLKPFVKEYDSAGKVLRTFRLDGEQLGGPEAKNGGFCAVRLRDGSTVATCTAGNRLVIFDKEGNVEWQLTTEEIGGHLQDVCGLQVLKNGHILVSCYGNQTPEGLKMLEVTRTKKVVWTYQNPQIKYVHTLQVLTTNGQTE